MSFLTSLRPTPTTASRLLLKGAQPTARGFARITIVGRLADTPEKSLTGNGQPLIRYALATSSGPRDNRQTSWWRVAAFTQSEKLEELLGGLGKGSLLAVEGECSISKYTAKDGSAQSALNITQRTLEILEKRSGEQQVEGEGEPLQAASG